MLNKHNWHQLKDDTQQRLSLLAPYIHNGKIIDAKDTVAALEAVIRSFDRVNIEGNNQKQADFFAECLCKLDPQKINGLHMVQSSVPLSTHLDLFEKGIAQKLDFAYAGPQDGRLAQLIQAGKIKLGAIHTYLELFSRYFVDLTPRVSLITAFEADKDGNLYTGFNTEDTPVIAEATHFRQGIVIAQVNRIVDKVPRVDIPGDWVNAVIEAPRPFYVETLIPAIESGWIQSVHCFGGELGMEKYVAERPDVFYIGQDGTLRSNRAFAQAAGHYALDMFIGGTLQIDKYGNSSTATASRVSGFGGAPNMGCDAKGRRHATASWLKCGEEFNVTQQQLIGDMPRGKRLVVQMQETFREKRQPAFVDKLDAWELAEKANLALPPVMVYADDVTHILTEEGIAYLHRCNGLEQRMAAIRAVAGYTDIGLAADPAQTQALRDAGIVKTPEDLGIDRRRANRQMLAAKSIRDLVDWSGGLYNPPARFRNW